MKKIIILLVLITLTLASCNLQPRKDSSNSIKSDNTAAVGITQGKMAPDFKLKNIDGIEVKLSDYKGKIVILNFFGVWCSWCIKEMPGFVKIYDEYKGKNVELLVVDVGDTKDVLTDYLKKNNFMIKPVLDVDKKVSTDYRVSGFPTSYIIDEKGIIKTVRPGYMDDASLKSILSTMVK